MPEAGGHNIEIARHLNESDENVHPRAASRGHHVLELVEAIILALVAITTAWRGYQAARWDANQSVLYGSSSRLRVDGQALEVESNQAKQYNAATVADWLNAEADGKPSLSAFFERRILPEFRPAFEAWKKTDPMHNPNAPAGPTLMPEFRDARGEEAARKNQEATELFEKGTRAREIGDNYVRVTVVLFLVAMSQRFKSSRIRVMLVAIAFVLLAFPLWQVLILPRA